MGAKMDDLFQIKKVRGTESNGKRRINNPGLSIVCPTVLDSEGRDMNTFINIRKNY